MTAPCRQIDRIDDHFAGRLSPRAEREMRAHASGCQGCRTRYRRHLRLEKLDARALGREKRLARGLGLARPARARTWAFTGLAGALALGGLLLLPAVRPQPDGRVHARGGVFEPAPVRLLLDDRGTEVAAFRTSGPGAPAPALPRIGRRDELAFAYRNGDSWPWLMVFGQDEWGGMYWFSPQWTDPAQDPPAVGLERRAGLHELPTAVSHDVRGGSLMLCALVSRQPLTTRVVEQALAGPPAKPPAEALSAPDRAINCQRLELAP